MRNQGRPQFQLRQHDQGRRLIWRNPFGHDDAERVLGPVLQQLRRDAAAAGDTLPGQPKSLSLGIYMPDPDTDRWGYYPGGGAMALAALEIRTVQERIAHDLRRLNGQGDE